MTKPKMPEPVAWLHVCRKKPELRGLLYEKSAPELAARGFVPEPLITTTQAEAYADAVRREALEEAASVAKQISDKYAYGYYGNEVDTADEIEAAIRALTPPLPGPATEPKDKS